MEFYNLLYWTVILEYWIITGLDMEYIVAREDGKDRNVTKSQGGANMDREDKELDWPIIGNEMRRLRNEMRKMKSVNLREEN